jgi:hypothetical protein
MGFNSKQYSWSDTKVLLLGKTLTGIQGVKYSRKKEKEYVYGRGSKPLAIQDGNESVEGELTLLQSELELLRAAVRLKDPTANITDVSFDIVVSYDRDNIAVTDVIQGCEIMEYEKGMKQGDKFMEISLKFMALDVIEGK